MADILTGTTATLGGTLQRLKDQNLRLFPILEKQFKHIQYAFFDVKELAGGAAGAKPSMTLKPKNIPGIDPTLTENGTDITWMDYALFDFNTTISVTDATTTIGAGNTITATFTSVTGFSENDHILITSTHEASVQGDEVQCIVQSINSSTRVMTLQIEALNCIDIADAGSPTDVVLYAGQQVERLFWPRNDGDEVLRPIQKYTYTEMKSYFQHFSRRIQFTKQDMNKIYENEGTAADYAQKLFAYNIGILLQEVNKAIYKSRNVAPNSGTYDKMQMMGLEKICAERGTIFDFATPGAPLNEVPLYTLFDQFELSFNSGSLISEEPLMLLVNDKFLTELAKEDRNAIRYDRVVADLNFQIPSLNTIYGEVDIVRDPMLNRLYKYSVAFIVPRSLIRLHVRENQSYNPAKGITRADASIKLAPVVNNNREADTYDIYFELGMIAGGISATPCPIRMLRFYEATPLA